MTGDEKIKHRSKKRREEVRGGKKRGKNRMEKLKEGQERKEG